MKSYTFDPETHVQTNHIHLYGSAFVFMKRNERGILNILLVYFVVKKFSVILLANT